MSGRAEDGTRWIDGKLFTFVYATSDKAEAQDVASAVRAGDYPCSQPHICGNGDGDYGEHYARVVRHDYGFEGKPEILQRWAVFCFPKG